MSKTDAGTKCATVSGKTEGGPESKTAGEWADTLMEYGFEINARFTESQRAIQCQFDLFMQMQQGHRLIEGPYKGGYKAASYPEVPSSCSECR